MSNPCSRGCGKEAPRDLNYYSLLDDSNSGKIQNHWKEETNGHPGNLHWLRTVCYQFLPTSPVKPLSEKEAKENAEKNAKDKQEEDSIFDKQNSQNC